ncbi:MAG: hypothetical protein JXX14_01095 [Deltaproteobacteria bacterium]|nr:hypothetical protein [Deltaproteobacteria bacterium]
MTISRIMIFLSATLFFGCSSIKTINTDLKPILITDLDNMAEEYGKRLNGEGLLIKFDKGDVLPVEVTSQLPFATLESGDNQLVFSQTTFVFLSREGAFISPDGNRFAPVYDGRAIKKLYPAKQGTVSIGFAITRDEGARLKTDVSLQ